MHKQYSHEMYEVRPRLIQIVLSLSSTMKVQSSLSSISAFPPIPFITFLILTSRRTWNFAVVQEIALHAKHHPAQFPTGGSNRKVVLEISEGVETLENRGKMMKNFRKLYYSKG